MAKQAKLVFFLITGVHVSILLRSPVRTNNYIRSVAEKLRVLDSPDLDLPKLLVVRGYIFSHFDRRRNWGDRKSRVFFVDNLIWGR